MSGNRLISLAAGAVQEFPPEEVVHAAARAGFGAAGIWCDPDTWSDRRGAAVRQALKDTGLCALAVEVVKDVGHPAGGILVDTLHLQRTGACAADLRELDPGVMPYLQLCDAGADLMDESPEGLLEDALYLRKLPGEGDLPLREVLTELDPLLPLSMEVRSRDLIQRFPDAHARATCIMEATRTFLRD
jgi:sugar phosphate isomerase/epimerase